MSRQSKISLALAAVVGISGVALASTDATAYWRGGVWRGAGWHGGVGWRGGYWRGAGWRGGYWRPGWGWGAAALGAAAVGTAVASNAYGYNAYGYNNGYYGDGDSYYYGYSAPANYYAPNGYGYRGYWNGYRYGYPGWGFGAAGTSPYNSNYGYTSYGSYQNPPPSSGPFPANPADYGYGVGQNYGVGAPARYSRGFCINAVHERFGISSTDAAKETNREAVQRCMVRGPMAIG